MDASSTIVDNPEVGGFLIDFWEGKITQNYKVDAPQYEKPLPGKKVWVPEAEYRAQRNRSQNYAQASPHTGYSTGTPREATDKQSSSAVTLPSFPASPQPRKSITFDGTYPASK